MAAVLSRKRPIYSILNPTIIVKVLCENNGVRHSGFECGLIPGASIRSAIEARHDDALSNDGPHRSLSRRNDRRYELNRIADNHRTNFLCI